jgi:hypothetical protein
VADEQSAGGDARPDLVAPAGGALLLSLGFRPVWLRPISCGGSLRSLARDGRCGEEIARCRRDDRV